MNFKRHIALLVAGDSPLWGDQGDGTCRNPVLPGDYSDLDCIRVGADYRTHAEDYQSETLLVSRTDTLSLTLAPGGGACVLVKTTQ